MSWLVTITNQQTGHTSQFAYDGLSRRISATETDSGGTPVTTKFLWCGERICEARDSSDTVLARYYTQGERHGSTIAYYAQDQVGSVVATVDPQGQVTARLKYDSYGTITSSSGTLPDYRYAGLYAHPQSGLYLATYRAYDPKFGRWLSRDPIREAGGINLYAYVGGNPINLIDPLGLAPPQNIPPGVDVAQNIAEAQNMSYGQWYDAVRNGGKWDYKQQGSQYQEFGNYNYGVTARAVGIPGNIPNRGAGWAQGQAGTSLPQWGNWWDWPSSTSFGDDPADQRWINEGIKDYENGYYDPKACN